MNSLTLLVRPRWIEGESWAGFLLRVANANELPGLSWLARYLEIPLLRLLTEQPPEVLRRLGYCADDIPAVQYPTERLQASRAGHKGKGKRQRYGLAMRGRSRATAVCPYCLSSDETPHVRAVWERPLEVGCKVHGTELLCQCRSCGAKLSVERPTLTECSCGASLLTQVVPALEANWTVLLPPFGLDAPKAREEAFQPTSYRELVATSVVERIALYERQRVPDKRKRRVSDKLPVSELHHALPWFASFPESFRTRYQRALDEGRGEGEDRRTSYIQAKTLIAPMFPRLHKVVRSVARELNFRPRACLQLGPEDYLGSADQSIASAVKLLGMSRAQVMWLATQGVLAGASRVSRHAMKIPTESILDLMSRLSETEDWKSAADRRGCRPDAMKHLLRIGLIDAIPLGGYGESRLVSHQWDAFADYLLSLAKPAPAGVAALVAVDAVIGASQRPVPDPERTARIVGAVANGSLPLYTRDSKRRRIGDLLVSISELRMVAQRDG